MTRPDCQLLGRRTLADYWQMLGALLLRTGDEIGTQLDAPALYREAIQRFSKTDQVSRY